MLKVESIAFALVSTFLLLPQVWTNESLYDFPLVLANGNYIIHATIRDTNSNQKWYIQEYIHSETYSKSGKISIFSESDQIDVFYKTNDEKFRLAIKDSNCDLFTYKWNEGWDKKLPGISNALINNVLLTGPSLIHRITNSKLQLNDDGFSMVRGINMQTVRTTISKRLNIYFYYKNNFGSYYGYRNPSRVVLNGMDPADSGSVYANLVMDVYLMEKIDQDVEKIVTLKPGIGCPLYFSPPNYFGSIWKTVHYFSIETVKGPKPSYSRNEVYADQSKYILSVTSTDQEKSLNTIYDYDLRIVYTHENGVCSFSPMTLNAPGMVNNIFSVMELLGASHTFSYLGKVLINRLVTSVWESVDYNTTTASGSYDKVVKTFYASNSETSTGSKQRIPIKSTINAYKASNGVYKLVETITRYYYDFGQEISDVEYATRFDISGCFNEESDRQTLAIKLTCKDSNCTNVAEKYPYSFHQKIRSQIYNSFTLSALRIGDVDVVSDSDFLMAYVTFYNFPELKDAFTYSYKSLSADTLKGSSVSTAEDFLDCIELSKNFRDSAEAIVHCPNDKSCTQIQRKDRIKEDSKRGVYCRVFDIPFRNIYRYGKELALDNIDSALSGLSFSYYDQGKDFKYTASQIVKVTQPEDKSRQLFYLESYNMNLLEDGINTLMASNVHNLADCYRACSHFDDNKCEVFSFCKRAEKVECLLSTSVLPNITDKQVYDPSCFLYKKNHLQDYTRIPHRSFIRPTSISVIGFSASCADLCYNSEECFSFQSCDQECTFGGYYTDEITRVSLDCDIYVPKMIQQYNQSGKRIVTETYHTEMDLTLDQCAALCFIQMKDDGSCVSFNYCPKGKAMSSSCDLSKYSAKDPSTKTIDADVCTNYELISKRKENNDKSKRNGEEDLKSGSDSGFIIIIVFIAVGLVIGISGPFVYSKTISMIPSFNIFRGNTTDWTRHTDETDDQLRLPN